MAQAQEKPKVQAPEIHPESDAGQESADVTAQGRQELAERARQVLERMTNNYVERYRLNPTQETLNGIQGVLSDVNQPEWKRTAARAALEKLQTINND